MPTIVAFKLLVSFLLHYSITGSLKIAHELKDLALEIADTTPLILIAAYFCSFAIQVPRYSYHT